MREVCGWGRGSGGNGGCGDDIKHHNQHKGRSQPHIDKVKGSYALI